jgi:large subunit ribosomal protein L25
MAQALAIIAQPRTERGKGAARTARRAGRIPAVIYGHGREPASLTVSAVDFDHLLKNVTGGSTVIEVEIDGTKVTTLIRELQRHPVRRSIVHIDFYEIRAGEVITVGVPIHLIGIPEGVRNSGGVLEQFHRELQIEVLPKNLPDVIDVDVTNLDLNDTIHVSDLTIANAKVLDVETTTICSVLPPRVEEEETPEEDALIAEEEGEEPELIRKAKDDEESEGGDEA